MPFLEAGIHSKEKHPRCLFILLSPMYGKLISIYLIDLRLELAGPNSALLDHEVQQLHPLWMKTLLKGRKYYIYGLPRVIAVRWVAIVNQLIN